MTVGKLIVGPLYVAALLARLSIIYIIGFFQWCFYMPIWKASIIVGIVLCYNFVSFELGIIAGLLLFELLVIPNEQ